MPGPDPKPRRRRKMQRVTMSDVAAEAQVSPSTVSLYLRKPEAVSARIGARVERAVERLGYVPSFVAGGLAAAGSRVVGVTVPSLRNAFFSETVTELERLLSAHGLHTLVGHTEYDPAREERLVRAALSWSPAAIILTGHDHAAGTRDMLRKTGTRVVEMWDIGPDPIGHAVGFAHAEVGREMARHLLARGYARPVFAGARLGQDARAGQRAEGFRGEITAHGLEAPVIEVEGPASTAAGPAILERAQALGADAVACSNDTLALGLLLAAQRAGVAVPGALAVAGFGDLEFAAQTVPPLTTHRPPAAQIAARVAEIVLSDEDAEVPVTFDTGTTFVARQST